MLTQGYADVPTGDLWTEEQPATKPQAGVERAGERGSGRESNKSLLGSGLINILLDSTSTAPSLCTRCMFECGRSMSPDTDTGKHILPSRILLWMFISLYCLHIAQMCFKRTTTTENLFSMVWIN